MVNYGKTYSGWKGLVVKYACAFPFGKRTIQVNLYRRFGQEWNAKVQVKSGKNRHY